MINNLFMLIINLCQISPHSDDQVDTDASFSPVLSDLAFFQRASSLVRRERHKVLHRVVLFIASYPRLLSDRDGLGFFFV